MTTNFIQPGDVIEATAPSGGITAGVGLQVGARLFGVALETKAEGATVQLKRSGVFTMAKTSALAITAGDLLYWDATNKVVNKSTSGQIAVGIAMSGAANPSATVVMALGVNTGAGT
jgi:predicted RecA/RadA family phage recombinase